MAKDIRRTERPSRDADDPTGGLDRWWLDLPGPRRLVDLFAYAMSNGSRMRRFVAITMISILGACLLLLTAGLIARGIGMQVHLTASATIKITGVATATITAASAYAARRTRRRSTAKALVPTPRKGGRS